MRLLPVFVGAVQAINILMNNDDGFGSGNLRETYRLLKEKGHNGEFVTLASFGFARANWPSVDCCACDKAERYGGKE